MSNAPVISFAPTGRVFLRNAGELGALVERFDWASTAIGPIDGWPAEMKSVLAFVLRSPSPIVTLWGDKGVMIYNDAYRQFAGNRHPELLGSNVLEGWHEVADFNANVLQKVYREGGTLSYRDQELTLVRDGTPRVLWADLEYSPAFDEAGAVLGVVAIVVETTERVLAERRAASEHERARVNAERVQLALAAGAIIGVWFWDLPTDRFTIDEAFAASFGIDPALGRSGLPLAQIIATVHPEDRDGLVAAIDDAIARGGAYAHQYRVRRADGRYYWIEANGRVDHAGDGTPTRFPGVLIDVQERRAVEAERDRAIAMLRTLNDQLEQRVTERTPSC
jgi:PAS domain S-box-containing protein